MRIITPFPAGSGPDAVMRMVAEKLNRAWGKPVIVDNRPGANGFIALTAAKTSPPDGYTLAQASNAQLTTHTLIYRHLPYDPVKDFAPITPLFRNSFFAIVGSNSPYKSVGELIAAAKNKPGSISYASEFVGSPGHLGALLLGSAAGVQMAHVPFKESTQLFAALSNNEVNWGFSSAATASAALLAGRVKLLAVGMRTRLPAYPDVPTVAETAGLPASRWTRGPRCSRRRERRLPSLRKSTRPWPPRSAKPIYASGWSPSATRHGPCSRRKFQKSSKRKPAATPASSAARIFRSTEEFRGVPR